MISNETIARDKILCRKAISGPCMIGSVGCLKDSNGEILTFKGTLLHDELRFIERARIAFPMYLEELESAREEIDKLRKILDLNEN